jgi:6-phosphofructokinase 1
MSISPADLDVPTLGECAYDSPLSAILGLRRKTKHYVDESDRVLLDDTLGMVAERGVAELAQLPAFEPGGPRRRIFFDPTKTTVGIVTCGGLCPGLNDVIKHLVLEVWQHYGVRRILGLRFGYQGLVPRYGHQAMELNPETVSGIGEQGGTILGSSRGIQDPEEMVDFLQDRRINILFVIGGDGSLAGAQRIAEAAKRRHLDIAVVGVPKTIDNDIPYLDHSFGFQTAYSEAAHYLRVAHVEAKSAPGGVGVVQLMGRHSGFIACYAALANGEADVVLVPEVGFDMGGEHGVLDYVRQTVAKQGHAVVVLAEGAGQDHLQNDQTATDASGNKLLGDVGRWFRGRLVTDFAEHDMELNVRYINPSYAIRGVPANPHDSVYCLRLAHAAVHAAMAGRTEMVVGRWHGRFVHVPMSLAISERNQVDSAGDLWLAVLESTGQPQRFRDPSAVIDSSSIG